MSDQRAVGVFDSGMGGLSVLRELRKTLPHENYVYYGDNANAPYGELDVQEITRLTDSAVEKLLAVGIKALVIACNTATSAAAAELRARLPLPVIGMEPALKPAQTLRKGGSVLVMATPATLRLPKFQALMDKYGDGAITVPIHGLVERVQGGELSGENIENFLHGMLCEYMENHIIDAVVLGCTHYIFVREAIGNVVGKKVPLVDGNHGTALRLKSVLEQNGLLTSRESGGTVRLMTSGDEETYIPVMKKLLEIPEI